MASKMQIGNLLVEAGIISIKTVERALEMQKENGKRLGMLLKDMGIVTEAEVIEALAKQYHLRIVRNFADQPFPKELFCLVPSSLAIDKMIFPLKQYQGMLAIATLDPLDWATFGYLEEKTGMKIYPALATREDIFAAIKKHYRIGTLAINGRLKVLLMDYSPIVTNLLAQTLEEEGYEVLVAHDGIDGLKLAYSHHPDIILCDLTMPRMDGYIFMQALKAHPEMTAIPILLMSSKVSPEEENHALKAGFVDFIPKPAMPVRVLARISKVFAMVENTHKGVMHNEAPVSMRRPAPRLRRAW